MNRAIRRKLIEAEKSPTSIEQQYEQATNLDKYQRKSRKKEEQLRRRENRKQRQRQGRVENN